MNDYLGHLATRIRNHAATSSEQPSSLLPRAAARFEEPLPISDSLSEFEPPTEWTESGNPGNEAPDRAADRTLRDVPVDRSPAPVQSLVEPLPGNLAPANEAKGVAPQRSVPDSSSTRHVERLERLETRNPVAWEHQGGLPPLPDDAIHQRNDPPALLGTLESAAVHESKDDSPPREPTRRRENSELVHSRLIVPRDEGFSTADPPSAIRPLQPEHSPARSPYPAEGEPDAPPVVKVTIGRIEVRAVTPNPPKPRPAAPVRRPSLSLGDYLKRRGGGRP